MERFRSAIEMYGGCGGRRAGAYVLEGVRAGAVGLWGRLVAPLSTGVFGEKGEATSPLYIPLPSVLLR